MEFSICFVVFFLIDNKRFKLIDNKSAKNGSRVMDCKKIRVKSCCTTLPQKYYNIGQTEFYATLVWTIFHYCVKVKVLFCQWETDCRLLLLILILLHFSFTGCCNLLVLVPVLHSASSRRRCCGRRHLPASSGFHLLWLLLQQEHLAGPWYHPQCCHPCHPLCPSVLVQKNTNCHRTYWRSQ